MVAGLLLICVGISGFCALVYRAAIYALPVSIGLWVGFAALHSGSGVLIAFAIGFVVGAIVFGFGQSVWNSRQPRWVRFAVALLFVVPAAWTSYMATRQLSALVATSTSWQIVLAYTGAIAVGWAALLRLAGFDGRASNAGSEKFLR